MLRIRLSIRLRLLHCARQSVCRDGRVGNKPSRAVLRTVLGVRAGFSAVDRLRDRRVRQVSECLYSMVVYYFQRKRLDFQPDFLLLLKNSLYYSRIK